MTFWILDYGVMTFLFFLSLQVLPCMQDGQLHPEGCLGQSELQPHKGRNWRASNLFLGTGNAEHVSYLFLGDLCSTSWSFDTNLMCLRMTMRRHITSIKASFQVLLLKNDALQAELQGLVGHKKAEEAQQGREAQAVVGQKAGVELTSWRHRFLLQFRRQGSNHHRDSRSSNLFLVPNRSTGNAEHVSYLFSRRLMFYFLELSAKLDVSPNDYEETHHNHQGFFPSFAF